MAQGWALLAGLTSVDPSCYGAWDGVSGCRGSERDVDKMKEILPGAGKYKITVLKTQQATASAILSRIDAAAAALKAGDTFVFYYSGHGGQKPDANGDEPDGMDESLVAYDREILDDELADHWLGFAPGVRIVMLTDCCNSGTNAEYLSKVMGAAGPVQPIAEASPIRFTGDASGMKAQLIHFGACRDGQASMSYMSGGAFTLALADVWKKGKGKFAGYEQLYEAIKKRLLKAGEPQEPQFNLIGDVQPGFLNSRPFSLSGKK